MIEWKKLSEELPRPDPKIQVIKVLWWRKEWGDMMAIGLFSSNEALATHDRCAWLNNDLEYLSFPVGDTPTHWACINYPT